MKLSKIVVVFAIAIAFGAGAVSAQQDHKPLIQMAILLDTSSSMDGLISQAKNQLWKIVNEFIEAKKNGRKPDLQVALYEYGNSGLSKESGYIRQVLPLTADLDRVSQELFALKTNGGEEYCGQVIDEAVRNLNWSSSADDIKAIFIAGNEPFTQGRIDYHQSVKAAINRGIVVNTIHCGTEQEGINGMWRDGALLADGSYLVIDQNKASVYVETPQDKKLAELGEKLNQTYVPYGTHGRAGVANQMAQDVNAANASVNNAANRAVFKSAVQYRNDAWDLVDALDHGNVKISEIDRKDLPENMQRMASLEQLAYVEGKRADRKRIQEEIDRLNKEREDFLSAKVKSAGEATDTLDSAMTKAIQSMMARKKFQTK
jgi:hypothetical protein